MHLKMSVVREKIQVSGSQPSQTWGGDPPLQRGAA